MTAIDIALRNAVIEIAKEFERENGRKNSAARIYIYTHAADKAARIRNYKSGNKQDVQAVALAYVNDDGTLDYKNADLAEATTVVLANKQNLTFQNVAYAKGGYIVTQGTTPNPVAPSVARVIGRIPYIAPEAAKSTPKADELGDVAKAPKKAKAPKNAPKKQAEPVAEDEHGDEHEQA